MPNTENYLDPTGLTYYHNRIKTIFPSKTEFDALDEKVDELITEGGEPNVIETVKVNGTALTPDAQKAVDVTVPTKVSDLTNDGDGESPFATEEYVGENGGKIDVIKVNGAAQTITDKAVDIAVPTQVSDLTNDSDFQTETEVQALIDAKVASAYKYKGSVADMSALDAITTKEVGDVYDVQDSGMNYAWNGTAWDALGSYVDTSLYWAKSELTAMTTAQIDAIFT